MTYVLGKTILFLYFGIYFQLTQEKPTFLYKSVGLFSLSKFA